MDQIEEALHQALPPPSSPPPSSSSTPMDVDASSSSNQPFALVKSVDEKGPAGAAVCPGLDTTFIDSSICSRALDTDVELDELTSSPLSLSFLSSSRQGLQPLDQIILFGTVNSSNHENLKALAALVGASEGVSLKITSSSLPPSLSPSSRSLAFLLSFDQNPISIQVLRNGQVKTLSLVPRSGWGGRGLIG